MTIDVATEAQVMDAPPAVAATARLIDPERVTLDTNGFAYRRWFVRLPSSFTADDTTEILMPPSSM